MRRLAIYHAVPDIALGILVFSSYSNGVMSGQITGFFSGLMIDFLSAAPLGLNALIRTIVGALSGLIKDIFVFDTIFLPMLLCAAATGLKALLLFLLHFLFFEDIRVYPLREPLFWIELALNTLIAPFLFALLRRFTSLLVKQKEV
jgi:rod shape-determining protein MreD